MTSKTLPPIELFTVITTEEQCQAAIERILMFSEIAVDFEWATMPDGEEILCLVQIATPDHICYIFDMLTTKGTNYVFSRSFIQLGLGSIFTSDRIVKIFHDCRNDAKVLFSCASVQLKNVIDTQITFALHTKSTLKRYPFPVSLGTLIKKYGFGFQHEEKEAIQTEMRKNNQYWLNRPLSRPALSYASEDVLALIDIKHHLFKLMETEIASVSTFSERYAQLFHSNQTKISENGRPIYGIPEWDTEIK